ncbi:MAG: AI-2E family transporter [Rubrivivax sp.]|nr:AI-2E family transporter [Rubrivivax sp.]
MATTPLAAPAARTSWATRGLFIVALIFAVREAQPLLAPVLGAIVLTFVLAPLVRALRRLGLPEVLGAAIVVLALLGSTVPLAGSLAPSAAQWWDELPVTLSRLMAHLDRVRSSVPALAPPPSAGSAGASGATASTPVAPPVSLARRTANLLPPAAPPPPPQDPIKDRLTNEGLALGGKLLSSSLSFGVQMSATVILLYFLLASEHWMLSRCVQAIPRRRTRALLLGGVRAAQREIGRFLVSLGIINAAAGALTGLALWAIGLPNPTLWGVLAAALCFIPYIGPLIVMALLLLAGITTFDDSGRMFLPLAAFVFIHAVESNIFSPWIVGRRLALSPISVFLSVMFWGWLWGITGALIAVPVLIAVRNACVRSRRLRLMGRFLEGDRRELPSLPALLSPRADGLRRAIRVRSRD